LEKDARRAGKSMWMVPLVGFELTTYRLQVRENRHFQVLIIISTIPKNHTNHEIADIYRNICVDEYSVILL
jgi:hypothetical protein